MRLVLAFLAIPASAQADSLVATRLIPAGAVVQAVDLSLVDADIPGAVADPVQAIGQSLARTVYPGRPILQRDLGPPMRVARNATVQMRYLAGGLMITADGRALEDGPAGAVIRVMALSSKSVVEGRIAEDGSVLVAAP